MANLQAIADSIREGRPLQTEKAVREALAQGAGAAQVLNEGMVPAIREVGEKFKNNEIYIPRILSAARAMSAGLNILQPYFESGALQQCGTVILGTAEGDLHDVGKNLVGLMLRSAGFRVIDIGVDVSVRKFVSAVEQNPDAAIVCISSLLSTSMVEMKQIVGALNKSKQRPHFKIMVGGAPVTQEFADEIGADAYTENAVDAAQTAKAFVIDI